MRPNSRVLAIRSGALGDTIVALPAIRALARVASVEVLGTAPYVELACGPDLARAAHSIDRSVFRALYDAGVDDTELMEFLGRFDRVVAWSRLPLLADKLERLGVGLTQSSPLPPGGVHASDHLMVALAPLGIAGPASPPTIDVAESAHEMPPKLAALHPSSGSPRKNWSPDHFRALAGLARAAGLDIVWIEGEADEAIVSALASNGAGQVARNLPLEQLAAVLASCAVYFGHDSGVSHLAAAVGAPTVVHFLSTDPVQWAPRGPRVRVVGAGASPATVWGFACELMNSR